MIKINISFSKKVPGEEQFSSLSFHGSLEKELSDGLDANQIQQAFHNSYELLEKTIEQEIENYKGSAQRAVKVPSTPGKTFSPAAPQTVAAPSVSPAQNSNVASQKQITFLNRLGAENGLSQQQIDQWAKDTFGVANIWQLTRKDASSLIEQLQKQKAS